MHVQRSFVSIQGRDSKRFIQTKERLFVVVCTAKALLDTVYDMTFFEF